MRPDHLPTPFSAEQIRDHCRLGRSKRLRTEIPGQPPAFRVIRFVEADAEGGVQESWPSDAGGDPIGEVVRRRSSWVGLQQHASKPEAATTLDETELELPFGRFACWRYSVRGSGLQTEVFWFAKELPGMPVQVEERDGEELRERTTMIANEPAP